MKGKVAPEETIPFIVTLKASVHASFYSMDLICKVGPPSKRSWMAHSSQSWGVRWSVRSPDPPKAPLLRAKLWKSGGTTAQAQAKALQTWSSLSLS